MPGATPRFWQRRGLVAVLLLPLVALFGGGSALRRVLYRFGWLRRARLPVPVVVVGNIAVGGSGKTPVVLWLVERLRSAGFAPGILSRGYGGRVTGPALVPATAHPEEYGDEPVLLARSAACPVVIGADRPAAGRWLLERHPECNVLVSDDGLQHYALERDVEIVVVDEAVLGNGWMLPAGPLREGLGRLAQADLLVAHGAVGPVVRAAAGRIPWVSMTLEGFEFVALADPARRARVSDFGDRPVHAVAGIGRPERFFAQLESMGLNVVRHPFPDHHAFTAADLAFAPGEPKILTAKDGVKCVSFATPDLWIFPVRARIGGNAESIIVEKLRRGSPTP
ncbi:MAG: tetraacyldisaccharide 4'-kinase, partial [Zoogloeaceae bacterium]|nr:tetraacyldisaccharide 4'-kinase [Zoogloeaceae bacterium]